MLFESIPNFSEGRVGSVVAALGLAASSVAGCHLLDSSSDVDHHRTVVSLAGSGPALVDGVFAAVARAVSAIDLRAHGGVHPRLGSADVVPFVPLGGGASLADCVALARELGARVWSELGVPVIFYGAALDGPTLAAVRRSSGAPIPFAFGDHPHPTAGVVSIAARAPLVAYNLVLNRVPLESAARLAASLRESSASGGGVAGVQALAFPVAAGIQLSMNLTRLEVTSPARARAEVEERLPRGGSVGSEEVVGLCPAGAAAGCAAADGRLLEARLGAAAARAAAARCAALATEGVEVAGAGPSKGPGGARREEMRRLGERLVAEAESLAALGFDEVLAGAERCAALRPVLRAGRIATEDLDQLLEVAAGGLHDAIPADVRAANPERMAALEPRLGPASPA